MSCHQLILIILYTGTIASQVERDNGRGKRRKKKEEEEEDGTN